MNAYFPLIFSGWEVSDIIFGRWLGENINHDVLFHVVTICVKLLYLYT